MQLTWKQKNVGSYNVKVLLKRVPLNSYTIEFHPVTLK